MAQKQDVFTLLTDLEHRALGITDDPSINKERSTGMIVEMLPSGLAVDDISKDAWTIGVSDTDDEATITRRQEAVAKIAELVDHKLALDGSGNAIPSATTISETWRMITSAATAIPLSTTIDAATQKALDEANNLLFVTSADGITTESPAYLNYEKYSKLYNAATEELSIKYLEARADKAKLQQWPKRGLQYKDAARAAWDKWISLGKKQQIEGAIDLISAQGTDAAVKMIALAKKRIEDNRVLIGDNEYLRTSISPANWCSADDATGWSQYTFDSSMETETTTHSKKTWKGKAGFWKLGASAKSMSEATDVSSNSGKVHISLSYMVARINYHYLTNILFNLKRWYMKGHAKGAVSNGKDGALHLPDETVALPNKPILLLMIKNVTIKSVELQKFASEFKKELSAGGRIGWGPFSAKGNYEKSSSTKKTGAEMTDEGLIIHGAQLVAYVCEQTPFSPFESDPGLNNK